MRRVLSVTVVLFLCAFSAAACGSNSNSPSKVAQFVGNYTGTYIITSCTASGDFQTAAVCPGAGSSAPIQLFLNQTGSTVSGNMTLGSLAFAITATDIAKDNSLTVLTSNTFNGITISSTLVLSVNSTPAITGSISQLWTSPSATGQLNLSGTLTPIIKT